MEGEVCAKWKPEAAVRIIAEFREWPEALDMPGMQRHKERRPGGIVESLSPRGSSFDESRRRRGRDAEIPTSRGDVATATWEFREDES